MPVEASSDLSLSDQLSDQDPSWFELHEPGISVNWGPWPDVSKIIQHTWAASRTAATVLARRMTTSGSHGDC
jgi:hypothetical protein